MSWVSGNKEDDDGEFQRNLIGWLTSPVFYVDDGKLKTLENGKPDKVMLTKLNNPIPDVFLKAFEGEVNSG